MNTDKVLKKIKETALQLITPAKKKVDIHRYNNNLPDDIARDRVYHCLSNQDRAIKKAKYLADLLNKELEGRDITFLCANRTGLYIATILQLNVPNSQIFHITHNRFTDSINAEEEASMDYIDYKGRAKNQDILCFVDDLVDQGGTFKNCFNTVKSFYKQSNYRSSTFPGWEQREKWVALFEGGTHVECLGEEFGVTTYFI